MKKPSDQTEPRSVTFWLFPILLMGTLLRFYHNRSIALWHEEAFSALYIRYPWGEMMHRIASDIHPPLYYWTLRLWSYIFGSGLLSLRSLSILFGVLTIYAGYLFVKKAFSNEKLAILTALFLAINPFNIQYSLEAQMYTLGTFLILLSAYFLVKALQSHKTSDWVCYGVTIAACAYNHYCLFFSIAAQGLYFLYYCWKEKTLNLKGLGAYLLGLVLFLPWVPILLMQIKRARAVYWMPILDRWSIPEIIWKMMFGGLRINHWASILAMIAAVGLIYYFFRETKLPMRWLIILSFIIPFAGSLALNRYFVFASLFFTIIIAATIVIVPKYTTRRALVTAFTIISLIIFFKNWQDLKIAGKTGMAGAASFINENARPTDKIYIGSSFVFFSFKYYNHTEIKPLLYSVGPLPTLLDNDDLIFDFKQTQKNDTVWLLWTTGFNASKPNVPGNWSKVIEKEYLDTPDFKGQIIVTEYHIN